jgi:hypothetical protein
LLTWTYGCLRRTRFPDAQCGTKTKSNAWAETQTPYPSPSPFHKTSSFTLKELKLIFTGLLRKNNLVARSNPTTYSKKFTLRLYSEFQLPHGTRRELASANQLKMGRYMATLSHTLIVLIMRQMASASVARERRLSTSFQAGQSSTPARDRPKKELKGVKFGSKNFVTH